MDVGGIAKEVCELLFWVRTPETGGYYITWKTRYIHTYLNFPLTSWPLYQPSGYFFSAAGRPTPAPTDPRFTNLNVPLLGSAQKQHKCRDYCMIPTNIPLHQTVHALLADELCPIAPAEVKRLAMRLARHQPALVGVAVVPVERPPPRHLPSRPVTNIAATRTTVKWKDLTEKYFCLICKNAMTCPRQAM